MWQGVQIDMQTDDNYEIFEDIEITVLSIFLLEILLKIFGFGLRRYLGYRMNIFDLSVVVMAIIGEAVAASENHGGGSSIGQELSGPTCSAVHPAEPYYELPLLQCSGCCASSPCSKA